MSAAGARMDALLTEAEAAALLRVKPETLRSWRTRKRAANKAPPHVRINKRTVRYRRADVEAWVLQRRTKNKD